MLHPLRNPTFRLLFASQILSLVGVGLMTAGLSLAAWRIGGEAHAGPILGLFFALKMVAYVGFSPLAQASLANVQRIPALIGLDLIRLIFMVPLVVAVSWWSIAGLAFAFFAVSSAFTPLFQALIPTILPEQNDYTQALALSRLAYTMESLLTPILVGAALIFMHAEYLFALAALGFVGSAICIFSARSPSGVVTTSQAPFLQRTFHGLQIYCRTPRLRGLFIMNFGLSLVMAWVLVNTITYAGVRFDDAEQIYPWLMGGYGAGSALMAFAMPSLLRSFSERQIIAAGPLLFASLTPLILLHPPLMALVILWALFGAASTLALTPGGLVLTRSATDKNRPAVFAAQFSLSHAGWLVAYPLAGWLGSVILPEYALILLGLLALVVTLAGLSVWPTNDPEVRVHQHPNLPPDHPHLTKPNHGNGKYNHAHTFHIDELHPCWNA